MKNKILQNLVLPKLLILIFLLIGLDVFAGTQTLSTKQTFQNRTITIAKGDTLLISSSITFTGCEIVNNGVIVNNGAMLLGDGTTLENNNILNNNLSIVIGTIASSGMAEVTFTNNSTLSNSSTATIRINTLGYLANYRILNNSGTVNNMGGIYNDYGEGLLDNMGTIYCKSHNKADTTCKGYCGLCGNLLINEANFPDESFRGALVGLYDKDSTYSIADSKNITSMDLSHKHYSIVDFTGLSYFTGLKIFDCNYLSITDLDVSKNTKLEYIGVFGCEELDSITGLSSCPSLTSLFATDSKLKKLDVTGNPLLDSLEVDGCELEELNLKKNTKLTYLSFCNNKISSIDLSKCTSLKTLSASTNNLTSLSLTKNTNLIDFACCCNKLTTLNVSKNTKLEYLNARDNQLLKMDLSNNKSLKSVNLTNNGRVLDLIPCRFTFNQLESTLVDSLISDVKGAKYVKNTDGSFYYIPTSDTITYRYAIHSSTSSADSTFTITSEHVKEHVYDINGLCSYCGLQCAHKIIKNGFCSVCHAFSEDVETFDVSLPVNVSVRDTAYPSYAKVTLNDKYETEIPYGWVKTNSASTGSQTVNLAYVIGAIVDASTTFTDVLMKLKTDVVLDSLDFVSVYTIGGLSDQTVFTLNGKTFDYASVDSTKGLVSLSTMVTPNYSKVLNVTDLVLPSLGGEMIPEEFTAVVDDSIQTQVVGLWMNGTDASAALDSFVSSYKTASSKDADLTWTEFVLSQKSVVCDSDPVTFLFVTLADKVLPCTKVLVGGSDVSAMVYDSVNYCLVAAKTIASTIKTIEILDIASLKEGGKLCAEKHKVIINGQTELEYYVAWSVGSATEAVDLAMSTYKVAKLMDPEADCNSALQEMNCFAYRPKDSVSFVSLIPLQGVDDSTKIVYNGDKAPSYVSYDSVTRILTVANYFEPTNDVVDHTQNIVSVYPNPVTDVVTVSCEKAKGISIYDLLNREILSRNVTSDDMNLDLSDLPQGSYLLKVICKNGSSSVMKLLKR